MGLNMNKKKVAGAIAIFVLIIVGIIVLITRDTQSKVAKLYNEFIENGEYLFEMKNGDTYEITIAQKGEQTSIDMDNAGEKTTTLVKDGVTYLILHSEKEYIVYENDISDSNIITDMFSSLIDVSYNEGKEEINGTKYNYEEYEGFAGFMISTSKDIEESEVTTRFYFDGNDLKYIKTLYGDEEELLQVNVSYEVDDSVFEIPSDYAEAN